MRELGRTPASATALRLESCRRCARLPREPKLCCAITAQQPGTVTWARLGQVVAAAGAALAFQRRWRSSRLRLPVTYAICFCTGSSPIWTFSGKLHRLDSASSGGWPKATWRRKASFETADRSTYIYQTWNLWIASRQGAVAGRSKCANQRPAQRTGVPDYLPMKIPLLAVVLWLLLGVARWLAEPAAETPTSQAPSGAQKACTADAKTWLATASACCRGQLKSCMKKHYDTSCPTPAKRCAVTAAEAKKLRTARRPSVRSDLGLSCSPPACTGPLDRPGECTGMPCCIPTFSA